MLRQRGHVIALGQPQQPAAQQGAAGEIERLKGLFARQREGQGLALSRRQSRQVDHGQQERRRRLDHLDRGARRRGEDRAQGLMTADDLAEAEGQHHGVERPFDAERRRQVVERAARRELIDEPQALLGERQRQGTRAEGRSEGHKRWSRLALTRSPGL